MDIYQAVEKLCADQCFYESIVADAIQEEDIQSSVNKLRSLSSNHDVDVSVFSAQTGVHLEISGRLIHLVSVGVLWRGSEYRECVLARQMFSICRLALCHGEMTVTIRRTMEWVAV